MEPIRLYEVAGVFAPPQSLTADEAVDLHRRRVLDAADYNLLSNDAAFAIAIELEANVRGSKTNGVVVLWGCNRKVRAQEGTA